MARLLHFAAAVALGGLATAGLTACTGDAEASPSPTPVVTVSTEAPSPTPTLTAEEELLAQIPEDARGESFPEAIKFAEFFVSQWDQMYRTRDAALFAYMCDDDCEFCSTSLAEFYEIVETSRTAEGGGLEVVAGSQSGGASADGQVVVTFDLDVRASTILEQSGEIAHTYPEEALSVEVAMTYEGEHWLVQRVGSEAR